MSEQAANIGWNVLFSGGATTVTPQEQHELLNGCVYGGFVSGVGFTVVWQRGPVEEHGRNGAMVEDVIEAAIARIRAYQDTKYNCETNAAAIAHLQAAVASLRSRTADRVQRGVEGTNEL